jgi:hypothetical protein
VHVWKSAEEFTVGGGDRVRTLGDLPGQFRSRGTGFECRHRRRDVLPIFGFEMR